MFIEWGKLEDIIRGLCCSLKGKIMWKSVQSCSHIRWRLAGSADVTYLWQLYIYRKHQIFIRHGNVRAAKQGAESSHSSTCQNQWLQISNGGAAAVSSFLCPQLNIYTNAWWECLVLSPVLCPSHLTALLQLDEVSQTESKYPYLVYCIFFIYSWASESDLRPEQRSVPLFHDRQPHEDNSHDNHADPLWV